MEKVLFIASVYAHLAAFHKPFMKILQENGYEVHAAGSFSMNRKDELLDLGIICHDIDFDRLPFSNKNKKAYRELSNLFKDTYFHLIHVHTPTAAFLTRLAASKHEQGKILYTAHGFHFFKGAPKKNWLFFYPAEKVAKRWTDGLIVMNEEDFNLGMRMGFKENHSLFYVHGVGVDLNEFNDRDYQPNELKIELGLDQDAVIVSCVAELSKRKNQMFLLENWKTIVGKCPNVHLLLIGDGEELDRIRSYIGDEDIINVHLLGYRNDVSKIIASSDIITLVSKHEGLPRCLMEAMACAKPIITTNVRGSRDLVVNEESGLIVDLNNHNNLIESFIRLIQDQQLRNTYGKRGKERIQNYSLKNVIDEMQRIYSRYIWIPSKKKLKRV